MTRYFFAQSNPRYGYMLFPHQELKDDSLRLPPYCVRDGHPTRNPELWSTLTLQADKFETGNRVLLYQAGDPAWLRGFWGYGKVRKNRKKIWIIADKILATPLILDEPTRKAAKKKFLKNLVGLKRGQGWAYRYTYAKISETEFKAFVEIMKKRKGVEPSRAKRKESPVISAGKAKNAFIRWAGDQGWKILQSGYPDLLAQFPNGKIAAFEAKLYPDEDLRDSQKKMFHVLGSKHLSITTLTNVYNSQAADEIKRNGWEVIAHGENGTVGWPDFLLKKGRKAVAVELKTGDYEQVKEMQIKTLAALSSQLHLEIHVVRAIREKGGWELYDDTERWLLYLPS